jgi:hypothetical protein
MKVLLRALLPVAVLIAARNAGASCLPKTMSTGYFYIIDSPLALSTSTSVIGHFWSPGAYASTGEQACDDSYWLSGCQSPGCGPDAQRTWWIDATLGQMGCTSGCPVSEMIVALEDKSTNGESAFFAVSRIDETPMAGTAFDFSRLGRDWNFVPMPVPQAFGIGPGEVFHTHFAIPDPAAGFYGLPGVPASGTITAFWVYTGLAPSDRNRADWTFVGRFPYAGGETIGDATLVCPSSGFGRTYLAAAIEFDSGQVATNYLSAAGNVDCDTYQAGAGAVRDGGPTGLFVDRDVNGYLKLTWGRSCSAGDDDYEIYEGTIGDWTSHAPVTCSTSGAQTATFAVPSIDAYYLVVPAEAPYEGSYGATGDGSERPLGIAACLPRIVNVCPP